MSTVVPPDATPFVTGFPSVSTRILYGQWIYTDGTGVASPPTISYDGAPYYLTTAQATMFGKRANAAIASAIGDSTVGVWWAEVIVYNDPDLIGDVGVRVEHPILPGGSVVVAVPAGSTPLNINNALVVQGTPGGMITIQGPPGPAGAAGEPGPAGQGISVQGTVANVSALPSSASNGQGWITADDGHFHIWASNHFTDVGAFRGPTGTTGPQGPTGAQGPAGADGGVGPQGPAGADGGVGPQGAQGNPGATGPAGSTGAQGPQGVQGVPGSQGPAGVAGPQGVQGPAGQSVQIQGSVANASALPTGLGSGDAGKGWITNDDGHLRVWSGSAFTDVGAVRGPTGPTGPAGADGPQGPQGAQGPAGSAGPQGVAGPAGSQGPQGSSAYQVAVAAGFVGSQSAWLASLVGPQGPQGSQGVAGPTGPTGPTGPSETYVWRYTGSAWPAMPGTKPTGVKEVRAIGPSYPTTIPSWCGLGSTQVPLSYSKVDVT